MAKQDPFAGLEPSEGAAGTSDPFAGLEPADTKDPFGGLEPVNAAPVSISMDIGDEYKAQPMSLDMPGGTIGSVINRMLLETPTPMLPNGFAPDQPAPPFEPLPTQEMPPVAPIGGGEQSTLLQDIPPGVGMHLPKNAPLDMLPVRGGGGAVLNAIGGAGKTVLGTASDGTDVGKLTMGEAVAVQAQRVAELRAEAQQLRQEAADLKSIHNEQLRLRGPVELGQMNILERQNALDWQIKLRDAELKEFEATKIANGAPPKMGAVRSAVEAFPATLGNLGIDMLQGGAQLLTAPISLGEMIAGEKPQMQRDVVRKFDNMRSGFNNWFASDSFYDKDIGQQVTSGVASLMGLAGVGLGARALSLAPNVATIVAGALPQAANAWNEGVSRQQYDPTVAEWKKWGAFVAGLGIGGTEALPISRAFERLENLSGGKVSQYFGILMAAGGEEMAQEGLQKLLENTLVQKLMYNDPNVAISDDVIGSALVGGLTGIIGGGIAIGGKMTMDKLAMRRGLGSEPQPSEQITPEQIQQFVTDLLGQQKVAGFETPANTENGEDIFAGLEPVGPTGNEATLEVSFPGTEQPVEEAAPVAPPIETVVPAPAGTVVPAPAVSSPAPAAGAPPAATPLSAPQGETSQQPAEAGKRGASTGIWAPITKGESGGDYNIVNGGKRFDLTNMTIAQVQDLQRKGWGGESTAAGRWQMVKGTLAMAAKGLGLDPNTTKFDQQTQDRMAQWLLDEKVGMRKWQAGQMSDAQFVKNLRNEWDALNKMGYSDQQLLAMVKENGVIGDGVDGVPRGEGYTQTAGGVGLLPDEQIAGGSQERDLFGQAPNATVAMPQQEQEQQRRWAETPKVESPNLETNLVSSDAGRFTTKPMVVDIGNILSSDMQGYASELQPRDRDSKASAGQIIGIQNKFDPNKLMPSPDSDRGPPIVNDRGMVESGNGRIMALREMYRTGHAGLAEYQQMMRDRGFNIDGMQMPVLVQQRMTPLTPEQIDTYVHGANDNDKLELSDIEQAKIDAKKITPEMIDKLDGRPNVHKSPAFVREFFNFLSEGQLGKLIDKEGAVTKRGEQRMKNAVFHMAYGNGPGLSRIAEDTDDNAKAISNAMMAAAPAFARLNRLIEAGKVPTEFDIREELNDAVNRISHMREIGMTFTDYINQQDFLNPIPPKTLVFMRFFYNGDKPRSEQHMTRTLRFWADQASMIDVTKADIGFDLEPVTREGLLEATKRKAGINEGRSEDQPSLLEGQGNVAPVQSSDGESGAASGPVNGGQVSNQNGDGLPQGSGDNGRGRAKNGGRRVKGKPNEAGQNADQRPERDGTLDRNEEGSVGNWTAFDDLESEAVQAVDSGDVQKYYAENAAKIRQLAAEAKKELGPRAGSKAAYIDGILAQLNRSIEAVSKRETEGGASPAETKKIGKAFKDAAKAESEDQVTHIFDPPAPVDVVRFDKRVRIYTEKNGWMTPAEAKAEIQKWKDNAKSQGRTGENGNKIVLSLFDLTGQWSKPWEEAGYQVWRFDIQADPNEDVNLFDTEYFMDNFSDFEGQDVYAILAACPCTDFAASGARHFAAKDADGRTIKSVELVQKTLATIERFKPSVWAIENPVGRIENLTGLPPWRASFQPNAFGEDYTKRTLLWGRFNADMPIAPVEATAGSKMHTQYGGSSQATKNARSETPEGFAYAFFQANNAIDNPVMALANKYDRLDPQAIEAALEAGLTEQDISEIVDDLYYMEMDDRAADEALREAAENGGGGSSGPAAENGRSRSTPMGEAFKEASIRYKGSSYTQAWVDAGLNPREAILLPPDQQIEILAKQFEAKYGIKVDLASRTQQDAKTFAGRTAPKEVDNYNAREVITQLLDGYQNLQALLASMGMPMSAANLALPNGSKLKLTFKSLQKNSTLGNYDPADRSITLSGRSNSFAHEYGHALDHYLMLRLSGTESNGDFMSKVIRNFEGKDFAHKSVQDAFANLVNAMFYSPFAFAQKAQGLSDVISKKDGTKAAQIAVKQLERLVAGASRARIQDSQFRADAKILADLLGSSSDYWASAIELLARSFEAYVAARVAQIAPGYDQSFITKGDEAYLNEADARLRLAYPRDEDRRQIFMAWSELFQAMQGEQIFGPDPSAQMPNTDNLFDVSTLDKIARTPERKVGNMPLAMREEVAEAVEEVKEAWGKVAEGAKNIANDPFKAARAGLKSAAETADDVLFVGQQLGYSTGGILHMLAERNKDNPVVAEAFDELGRLVTTRPGRGEVVKQTFEEGITQRTAPFVARIDEAVRQFGLEKITPREKEMLRELLTQLEEGKKLSAYPQKLKDMAFVIRATFDEIYDMMQKAGVPIAYSKDSYLPRIFNLLHIDDNANRFERDAIELYQNEFDQALGDDASTATPEELLPILDKLLIEVEDPKTGKKVPARFAKTLGPIRSSIKKLVGALDKIEKGMKDGSIEPDMAQDQMDKAAEKLSEYINENLEAIRDAFATTAAERMMSAIRLGSATDFATKGPESGFTKVRTLSQAADQIMREWYINDPLELAYTYIHQASTRAEYAQRFGAGGEKIEQLLTQAQGPLRPDGSRDWDSGASREHIRLARQQMELITGQISANVPGGFETVVNVGMALGTLILLRGATIASIPEHIMVWQRSEDWKAPLRTMVGMWQDAFNTADAQERHELALHIGIIANANFTNIVASQFNADTMSKKWQNRLQWMFRHTGLIKLTEIQSRNIGMINGHQYLSAMLDRVNHQNPLKADAARRHLADLGIDPELYDAMRDYIKDGLPPRESIKTNIGQIYGTALLRFTRETIQEAYKSDRPGMMFNPHLKIMGGIQSFNYSHQKKVLMRAFRVANADAKAMKEMGYGKAAVAGHYAGRLSMQLMVRFMVPMLIAQFMLVAARSLLGDYERWKEESENGNLFNWLFGKSLDKVGTFGAWSPIVNAFAGLTYNRDLTTLTAGPQIGYFLQNIQGAYTGFKQAYDADHPQTQQNRLNEAYKATYQALIAPLLLTGLAATNAQANLIAKPLAALMFFAGSGTASQAFANAVAGEKKPVQRGMFPRGEMSMPPMRMR